MMSRNFSGFVLVLSLLGCSSNGDDGETQTEWRCFEGSSRCWCVELTPGNDASSSDPEVDHCTLPTCVSYRDGDSRHCECGAEAPTPTPFWEDPEPARECPLD
jgi:hypothetical protein